MASTVLPNGIIIPEKYSRDWYNDLYHNWQELDNLLGGGTPKDGTLTIQKNGTTVGTFSANQATDETIDITVPDVNDATLTIQQNGTTVDTFTANSSTDKTVDITVPTKTSDLTNDSGFITEDTTKIPLAGSNQISGSLIPATTDAYDLGGVSYQWNNAYIKSLTINGVACGDILTHNASEFVDVTTAQTIGGQKIFSHGQIGIGRDLYHFASNPYSKNTPPTAASYQYIRFIGNSASQGFTNNWYSSYIEQQVYPNGSARGRWFVRDTSESGLGIELFVNGNDKQFRPHGNNITDLGTSTNKWKSFNGINPGALSLPGDAYIDIDTTNWVLDGSGVNSFTPTSDGWLGIQVTDTVYDQMHYVFVGRTGGGSTYYQQNILSPINALWDGLYHGCIFIPVVKNSNYDIRCICSTIIAKFYPCQGNV